MKFERGNKVGHGGKRPGAGRPSKLQAAAKEEMVRVALDALRVGMGEAVQTLIGHLTSEQPQISIRAAEDIVEFALKGIQCEELERRIKALEENLIQQGGIR